MYETGAQRCAFQRKILLTDCDIIFESTVLGELLGGGGVAFLESQSCGIVYWVEFLSGDPGTKQFMCAKYLQLRSKMRGVKVIALDSFHNDDSCHSEVKLLPQEVRDARRRTYAFWTGQGYRRLDELDAPTLQHLLRDPTATPVNVRSRLALPDAPEKHLMTLVYIHESEPA